MYLSFLFFVLYNKNLKVYVAARPHKENVQNDQKKKKSIAEIQERSLQVMATYWLVYTSVCRYIAALYTETQTHSSGLVLYCIRTNPLARYYKEYFVFCWSRPFLCFYVPSCWLHSLVLLPKLFTFNRASFWPIACFRYASWIFLHNYVHTVA